jgi:hypothetical protein
MLHKANTQQIDWNYATGNFKEAKSLTGFIVQGRQRHAANWRPPPPHSVRRPLGYSWRQPS